MRVLAVFLCVVAISSVVDAADKPISVEDAAKKVNEKVTIQMEVKSTGGKGNYFLNSETNYKDEKNFTIFIPRDTAEKFKNAKIDDPAEHFKGKTIIVSGTVTLYQKKPQINIDNPEQIEIVEKK
jgi:DNA/RNA endonuclease YhcR with UshA esterase domain